MACWEESPFVALTACLAAGIAASSLIGQYFFVVLVLADAALIAAAWLALIRNRPDPCLALGLVAVLLAGALLGLAHRDGYPGDDVRALLARASLPLDELLLLDGCVLGDSVQRGPDIVTTMELHGVRRKESWIRCRGTVQLRMALPDEARSPETILRAGDRIRAWAECDVPRNFQNPGSGNRVGFLASRGIFLLARTKSAKLIEVLPRDCGTAWDQAAAAARRALHNQLQNFGRKADPRQAAVLSSIVLGDYAELSTENRTEFQNAGTYHVLVVSGLHISWIAWVLIRFFRFLRVPSGASRLLAACGILFYTCLVGFQASISRSLWMFTLYLIGQSLFRRAAPANIVFACGFLLLCARPAWLPDIGFQLSFLSVIAIAFMGTPMIERVLRPLLQPLHHAGNPDRLFVQSGRWHAYGRRLRVHAEMLAEGCADRYHAVLGRLWLAAIKASAVLAFLSGSMVLISLSVQVWLAPVLAFYFNRLSWVAPAANLIVVPISSLVLAAGMAAELAAILTPFGPPAFQIAGWFSSLLLNTNRWFADLPGAWQRCPTPPWAWVSAGLLLIFLWCWLRWRRTWIPCAVIGIELTLLSMPWLIMPPRAGSAFVPVACKSSHAAAAPVLRISFLDVGQGDAIVIQFPDGKVWVVDAGGGRPGSIRPEERSSFDIGEAVVSRFLWSQWISGVDRAIVSHPHQDHAGGMPAVLENFSPTRLNLARFGDDPVCARVIEAADRNCVFVHAVVTGERWDVAGVSVSILHPAPEDSPRSLNDGSVVMRLEFGRFSALFAGDLEGTGETELLQRAPELRSMLLKVAHHGSRNATLDPFLDRVQPRWAVVSAGRKNPFGNPSPETLSRLSLRGARLLLTMELGAIHVETDGISYRIRSHTRGILETGSLAPG